MRAEDDVDGDDDGVDIEPDGTEEATAMTEDEEGPTAVGKSPDGESTVLFLKPKAGLVGLSGAPGKHLLSCCYIYN